LDPTALFKLSYGLYVVGAKDKDGRYAGCVVNTVTQATAKPVTLTVCINKDNFTNACIKRTGKFTVSILSEETPESVFGIFGFSSSRDRDKFAEAPHGVTPSGLPYLSEHVTGYFECRVLSFTDNFTHTIFVAEVTEAENLSGEPPMTYAYYHSTVKGKTPKNAPTFSEAAAESTGGGYVCGLCGYEFPGSKEEFERLPDGYVCPICGAVKGKFVYHSQNDINKR